MEATKAIINSLKTKAFAPRRLDKIISFSGAQYWYYVEPKNNSEDIQGTSFYANLRIMFMVSRSLTNGDI